MDVLIDRLEKLGYLGGGRRNGEQVSLYLIEAQALQDIELIAVFHAFSHGEVAEFVR